LLEVTGEHNLINLVIGAVEFPKNNMQEQEKELGHIDLVLSQILTDILQELQMSVMQDIKSHAEKKSSELAKVTSKNVALEMEFRKVKQERDEATKKVQKM
jgi:hypothetical protein